MGRVSDPTPIALLDAMWLKAKSLGCTRLADVTGLDRIGLPVFQAIRPASRALSVHQGKGATKAEAKLSALGEAIESGVAENLQAEAIIEDYAARMYAGDALAVHPLCEDNFVGEKREIEVCSMEHACNGRQVLVPHAMVSMDFTQPNPLNLERSSNGLGLGVDFERAASKAVFECIERDAIGHWFRLPRLFRESCALTISSLPFGWDQPWSIVLSEMNIVTRVYAVPTLTSAPCFFCSLIPGATTTPRGPQVHGSACGADPIETLHAALMEAIQSRLTIISGARDDLMRADYKRWPSNSHFMHCKPGMRRWSENIYFTGDWREQAENLHRQGFEVYLKQLTGPSEQLAVIKALAPAMGSLKRQRSMVA